MLAACLATAAVAGTALAQQGPGRLEEIVVTAQKRSENVQDIPISIVAVSEQQLEARGTQDISEITAIAPNIQFKTTGAVSGSSAAAAVTIRGVGQTDWSLSTEPGVGIYVDGVYMARSVGGVIDVLDLERIELLRGPQGTLFGRNTIGGAISLITKRPGDEVEGKLELIGGDRDRLDFRGALNLPLGDRAAARLSVSSRNQDGFQTSLVDGRTYGNRNRDTARLQLRLDVSDRLQADLAFDGTRIREDSAPSTLVGVTIDPPGGRLINPSISFIYNAFEAPLVDVPGFGVGVPFDSRWVPDDIDTNFATGFDRGTDLDIWGGSLTLSWALGTSTEVKSITAYREVDGGFSSEADASPLTLTEADTEYYQDQFTQELQVTGSSFSDRLKWVLGGFYLRETGFENEFVPIAPLTFGTVVSLQDHSTRSIAAYAQASYALTDTVGLTLGGRYTSDEKTNLPRDASLTLGAVAATAIFADAGLAPGDSLPFVPQGVEVDETFTDFSPRIALDYIPRDDLMLYASYSRGFKSGGFNIRYLVPRPAVLGYDPETLSTVEAGVKWTAAGGRVRVNASGYFSTWDDLQVVVFESFGAPLVQNAGEAEITGFEIETNALPVDDLELSLAVGYLSAEYKSINNPTTTVPDIQLVTADKELPNAPEWTLNASIAYSFHLPGDGGRIVPRIDWSYTSDYENDAQNSEFLSVDGYELVNAALSYQAPDDTWSVTAFVNNATDSRFITAGNSNFSIGFHEGNYNEPRNWGVRALYRF